MTSETRYAAVADFLDRFYAHESDEIRANINAIEALRPDFPRRLALACEMRSLLTDPPSGAFVQRFVLDHAERDPSSYDEARAFLLRIFEANLFDVLAPLEEGS